MICPDYLVEGLEKVFETIHEERMQDVPVLNPQLLVQAVGFRHWEGHCLGVLITPWFINLMLLPEEGSAWDELRVGEKVFQRFPSGVYEFTVGAEQGIGRYQMCSLFSPVFQFEDQEAAVATAVASLEALMDEENHDASGFDEQEVQRRWRGEETAETEDIQSTGDMLADEEETPLKPTISRRTFITGGLSRDSE